MSNLGVHCGSWWFMMDAWRWAMEASLPVVCLSLLVLCIHTASQMLDQCHLLCLLGSLLVVICCACSVIYCACVALCHAIQLSSQQAEVATCLLLLATSSHTGCPDLIHSWQLTEVPQLDLWMLINWWTSHGGLSTASVVKTWVLSPWRWISLFHSWLVRRIRPIGWLAVGSELRSHSEYPYLPLMGGELELSGVR